MWKHDSINSTPMMHVYSISDPHPSIIIRPTVLFTMRMVLPAPQSQLLETPHCAIAAKVLASLSFAGLP